MTPQLQIGPPTVTPAEGIRLLSQQITRGEELLDSGRVTSDGLSSWELLTQNFLVKAFGEFSPNVKAVTDIGRYGSFPMNASREWWDNHRVKSLSSKLSRLRGLVELLQTEIELEAPTATSATHTAAPPPPGKRVFLVHGRDDGLLHEVARYLERLELEPLILREQPNSGRTIIEKFVDFSDVSYAVVLLTPDDRGGLATVPYDEQRARARQNVILELGYFLGKLSRSRVTALYASDIEIPSDYSGVAFVALDDRGAWRLELARELKAAGLDVDMNKAL